MLANYIGWLQAAVVPRQPRQRGEEPTLEFVQWQLWDWHIRAQFPFILQRRTKCSHHSLIIELPQNGKHSSVKHQAVNLPAALQP